MQEGASYVEEGTSEIDGVPLKWKRAPLMWRRVPVAKRRASLKSRRVPLSDTGGHLVSGWGHSDGRGRLLDITLYMCFCFQAQCACICRYSTSSNGCCHLSDHSTTESVSCWRSWICECCIHCYELKSSAKKLNRWGHHIFWTVYCRKYIPTLRKGMRNRTHHMCMSQQAVSQFHQSISHSPITQSQSHQSQFHSSVSHTIPSINQSHNHISVTIPFTNQSQSYQSATIPFINQSQSHQSTSQISEVTWDRGAIGSMISGISLMYIKQNKKSTEPWGTLLVPSDHWMAACSKNQLSSSINKSLNAFQQVPSNAIGLKLSQ